MSVETTNLGTVVSWRVGGGRGVDPSGRFWRRGPLTQRGHSPRRRIWRLVGLAVALGAGLALLLWLIAMLRLPRPARLVLVGAGYQANLQIPHNAPGWAGLRDLARLGDQRTSSWLARVCGARYRRAGDPILLDARSKDRWADTLRGIPEPTIVVVMAMHGGVDREGAYLLPEDAAAVPDSADRLRMKDVLRAFESLPRSKKKVLILDATGLPYHWELGMLRNDFAAALAGLEPEIRKIPNLLVISASGEGERSWASEAWGRTAFQHFLLEALTNAAAGPEGPTSWDPAPRVNLEAVCDEVSSRLKTWAARHRRAPQQPLILPSGEAWRKLARSVELPPIRGTQATATPADAESDGPPARMAVLDRWDDYRKLATAAAPPSIAAPVLWRRYQQLLRRYDDLTRSVEPEDDREYRDVVAALDAERADLGQGRSVRLSGAPSATLVMPVAEGITGPDGAPLDPTSPDQDVRTWFEKTWWPSAEGQDRTLWQKRKEAISADEARDLAAQLGALVLDRAIDDPAVNLDRAARLARLLDQPPQRPAELNFLIMLRPGLPPDWKTSGHAERVGQALKLRLLAERAALGLSRPTSGPDRIAAGPLVAAWVGPKVEEGDRHRRAAEDFLMASDRPKEFADVYVRAETAYNAAIEDAEKVRRAILARDRGLSDLVPITEWLAGWFPTTEQVKHLDELVDAAEDLWRQVHALSRALEVPDPTAIEAGPESAGVDAVAAAVERAHSGIKKRIETLLNEDGGKSQAPRSAAELRAMVDALTLPWLGRNRRNELLNGREQLRREDRGAGDIEPAPSPATPGGGDDDPLVNHRRRLALAMLGPHGGAGARGGGTAADSARRIAAALDGRVGEIARLIGRDDATRGAEWASNLPAVDRLVRLLDGPSNERIAPRAGPADALSLLRLEDYLIGQARRIRADLWHDDRTEAMPYDRRVADACLDDAREIDGRMREARRDRIEDARKAVARPDGIRLEAADRLVVTSEEQAGLSVRLEPDDQPDLRTGLAVSWFEGDRGFTIGRPAKPANRQAVPLGGAGAGPIDVLLRFPDHPRDSCAAPSSSTLLSHAYFRGRSLGREVSVDRRPTPSRRIVHTPPPAGGGIVVRGDPALIRDLGRGGGSVAIVLDASRSMWASPGQPAPSKFREATEALRSALAGMPAGTIVSLWAFGEAMGASRTVEPAEQAIRRLQRPVAWDPALLDPLMSQVAAIEPWNLSPILHAMLSAAEDLRGAVGFKTLLVLTDGADNRWHLDTKLNPDGLDVATSFRAAFEKSGIAVNVVAYRVPTPAEREQVRAQFEGLENFREPGRFATAERSQELIAAIGRALTPALRFTIDGGDGAVAAAASPLGYEVRPAPADSLGEPIPLPAGGYRLRLLTPSQPGRRFLIDDGDWLLARIIPTPAGPGFERELYSRVAFGLRPAREDEPSGWRLAAIQNQILDGTNLRMTATFERRPDPGDTALRQARPREAWFDVEPAGGGALSPGATLQVADRWGYPAPAWKIDVSGWLTAGGRTQPATPVLRVWWDADDEAIPAAVVERGRDFQAIDDLEGFAASIEGRRLTIESVRVEEHEVDVGGGTRQKTPCLVVRVAYPKDDPCWARPYGLALQGWEHRFYEDVGKYTGLFWPVTPAQADTFFRRLGLISVASFRRQARTIRLDNLDPPDPLDVGPLPIAPAAPTPPPPPALPPVTRAGGAPGTAPGGHK